VSAGGGEGKERRGGKEEEVVGRGKRGDGGVKGEWVKVVGRGGVERGGGGRRRSGEGGGLEGGNGVGLMDEG